METIEKTYIQPKPTIPQNIGRILLGSFLTYTGIGHLTFLRKEFLAQVPPWLPVEPDTVVLLSGVAEISLGLSLLLLSKQRKEVGWATAAFFVAIFPRKYCPVSRTPRCFWTKFRHGSLAKTPNATRFNCLSFMVNRSLAILAKKSKNCLINITKKPVIAFMTGFFNFCRKNYGYIMETASLSFVESAVR